MTTLAAATRIHSEDGRLVARCEPCDERLHHVQGFDVDVALGTFFHHHPNSGEAVHRPQVPAGWQAADSWRSVVRSTGHRAVPLPAPCRDAAGEVEQRRRGEAELDADVGEPGVLQVRGRS